MSQYPIRLFFVFTILSTPLLSHAQKVLVLNYVKPQDTVPQGYSIIYGNFFQRLGFGSNGLAQLVSLKNVETGAQYELQVKPAERTHKQNLFCYYLPPGTYLIKTYRWALNEWIADRHYNEPIYAGVDASAWWRLPTGATDSLSQGKARFTFKIESGTLNYAGEWHFETGLIRFENDKGKTDKKLQPYLRKIKLTSASTVIPQ